MIWYYIEDENEVAVKMDSDNKIYQIKKSGIDPAKAKSVEIEHPWVEKAYMHGKEVTEKEYNEY